MTDYSVTVESRRPGGERFEWPEDLLDAFMDELAPFDGVCTASTTDWSATVAVDAADAGEAAQRGHAVVVECAARAGLPGWPVVQVETYRGDVFEEKLCTSDPALGWVSGPDAAEILGVTRQRLHQLRRERADFPKPLFEFGAGAVWARSDIEAFDERRKRERARRRRTA